MTCYRKKLSRAHARRDAYNLARRRGQRYETIECECGWWHVQRRRRGKNAKRAA